MNAFKKSSRVATLPAVALLAIALAGTGCGTTLSDNTGTDTNAGKSPVTPPRAARTQTQTLTVPSGTLLPVQFDQTLSTSGATAGDTFTATVADPIYVDGQVAIASGSRVRGRVVEAVGAKKIGGSARLNLEFNSIELADGKQHPFSATFHQKAKSQTKKDAATIGGATAGGALLGRIIGHNNGDEADGTAIGAVVGAAVGTAIAASNKGQEVTIPTGVIFDLQIQTPIRLTVAS